VLHSPSRPLSKEYKYSYIPPYVLLSIDYPHYLEPVIYSTPQPALEPGFEKLKQTLEGKESQGSPVLVQARASRRGCSEYLFSPTFRERLSDKSKRALFGSIVKADKRLERAKKPC
jgi:hypothetical protein